MEVTNSATKTTAPQNDLSRTISIMPSIQKWAATFDLMHHDGILVHLTTRFFDSAIRDCQPQRTGFVFLDTPFRFSAIHVNQL